MNWILQWHVNLRTGWNQVQTEPFHYSQLHSRDVGLTAVSSDSFHWETQPKTVPELLRSHLISSSLPQNDSSPASKRGTIQGLCGKAHERVHQQLAAHLGEMP